jgi:hypothetical protein
MTVLSDETDHVRTTLGSAASRAYARGTPLDLAMHKLFSKIAWAIRWDPTLLARVGYKEALELAQEVLKQDPEQE